MPRPIRRCEPGEVFHIVTRGNRKAPIFHCDEDFQAFYDRLIRLKKELPFTLHAFCEMTNHFHLLIQVLKDSMSDIMQALLTWYAKYYNARYEQVGHVFQGRFKSSKITTDGYFMEAVRYIHFNPVYAGIVSDPGTWPWSGHREMLRGGGSLIDGGAILSLLSVKPERAIERYIEFMENGLTEQRRLLHPGIQDDARVSVVRQQVFDEVARRLGTAELPSRSRRWKSLTRQLFALHARDLSIPAGVAGEALACSRSAYKNLLYRAQREP